MRFRPGDLVEFLSGRGVWLPAVVAPMPDWVRAGKECYAKHERRSTAGNVRLQTGPGVCVVRPEDRVRLRVGGGDRTEPLPPGEGSSEGGGALPDLTGG